MKEVGTWEVVDLPDGVKWLGQSGFSKQKRMPLGTLSDTRHVLLCRVSPKFWVSIILIHSCLLLVWCLFVQFLHLWPLKIMKWVRLTSNQDT